MYGNFLKGVIKIGQERVRLVYERFRCIAAPLLRSSKIAGKSHFVKNVYGFIFIFICCYSSNTCSVSTAYLYI